LNHKIKAFTLIELLIVIAIILILIAIALPNFLEAQMRAKVARVRGDMRTIAHAMNTYYLDFRIYPTDHDPDDYSQRGLYQLTTPLKYLTKVPEDAFNTRGSGINIGEPFFEMASTGISPVIARFRSQKVHAFAVFSHGPDNADDFDDNDRWPFCGSPIPCPRAMGYLNYGPTNGTRSRGDLVQTGGEVRSGRYCIDHHQIIRGFFPPNPP
jgi:prepilin-type N-terminal cleavage/methylation domain-containing protein